jgi:hypothetical protein
MEIERPFVRMRDADHDASAERVRRQLRRDAETKRLARIDPASQNPDDLALLAMGRRVRPIQRLPKPAYE